MKMKRAAAAVALCFAMLVIGASAHGFLAIPKSRNYLHNSNYCPHCLNAGGVGATRGTNYPFNEDKHGICGDAISGSREHEAGGKYATGEVTGVYEQGEHIHLAAAMSTYHKGFIGYRICSYPAGSPESERAALTEDCLNKHVLKQADVPGAQIPGGRYYFLGNASDNGFYPPRLFHHTFQLPSGLTCDGVKFKCVVQWRYVSGNSCNDPEIPNDYKLRELSTCGNNGAWPEEFWNCADVKIVPKGTSGVTKPDPNWPAFSEPLMQGSNGGGWEAPEGSESPMYPPTESLPPPRARRPRPPPRPRRRKPPPRAHKPKPPPRKQRRPPPSPVDA